MFAVGRVVLWGAYALGDGLVAIGPGGPARAKARRRRRRERSIRPGGGRA